MCRAESSGPLPVDEGTSCRNTSLDEPAFVRDLTRKWQCDDDVRSEIARVAKNYVKSKNWREDKDGVVKA